MIFSFDETVVFLMIIGALMFVLGLSIRRDLSKKKPKRPDKKKEKALAKLKEIQDLAKVPNDVKPADAPPPVSPPVQVLEQFPISRTIQIELTRMRDVNGTHKRTTVRTGRVTLVPRFQAGKDLFFFYIGARGYFIDPAKIISVKTFVGRRKNREVTNEKLVYDILETEPLNSDGTITFSWDVERLLVDSGADQYITVATFEGGFQLTPTLVRVLLVVGFLGGLTGLAINGSAHVVPQTIIHWVP